MSENLKRAESLFNRIMNQNKPVEPVKPYKNHRYNLRKYHQENHPPHVEVPKRDPVKEARVAVDGAFSAGHQHILAYCWTIWHHSRLKSKSAEESEEGEPKLAAVDLYLQAAVEIEFPMFGSQKTTKSIASLEQLWTSMSTLKKSHELTNGSELLIFKTGVNPVWEDPINAKGGRWIFRFNHRLNPLALHQDSLDSILRGRRRVTLVWERLVLKTLSGCLLLCRKDYQEALLSDIVGLVLSIRRDDVIVSLWNLNLNFSRKKHDDDDKKGLNAFHARRVYCDAILRVIREADLILLGADCIDTVSTLSNERVNGVAFEYRLHSDNLHTYDRSRRKHYKDHDRERGEREER